MPLIGDHIKVGRCYGMIIGGKLIIAKVIQIYPLDINVAPKLDGMRDRKFPSVTESIVRWAWRDAAGSGKWRTRRDGCFRPSLLQPNRKSPAMA